jgi:hypothetical protein
MAKRARGSTIRPGQRAPKPRGTTTARPTTSAPTPPPTLTEDEAAQAAALEAQIVANEKAADDASRRSRDRARRVAEGETVGRPSSIAVAASQEYAYVARDIRRIVTIGGGLVVLLILLWVVVTVTGIGPF